MVFTTQKIIRKYAVILVFSYLILFPLGQLINVRVANFKIHPIDILVFFSIPALLIGRVKLPEYIKFLGYFVLAGLFSLVLSFNFYPYKEVLIGSLYIFRLIAYVGFSLLCYELMRTKILKKEVVANSLIAISAVTAFFGILQYIWVPDLTSLRFINWDDHLGRLTGTFLDPGFTGIILVFGALFSLYFSIKQKKYLLLLLILLPAILLTYSRASILSFLVGGSYLIFRRVNKRNFLFGIIILFLILIPFLPKPKSEGVELLRTASINARIGNYQETYTIFRQNPLFGVGFNNICSARLRQFGGRFPSNACYGADSSALFILATTGIVGLSLFLNIGIKIWFGLNDEKYALTTKSILIALLIHGLFLNSMFYPWVMGYMGVLLAISLQE